MRTLIGRQSEIHRLRELLVAAGRSEGGVLVLRGEPGIGKTALLASIRSSDGFRVIEASGSEFESELPFAALHQFCVPVLGQLDELPDRLKDALRVAFGLADGTPDLFRIGLATLELLAVAARDRPVLCLVDDAHWLDDASAKALSFLARRVSAEPVVIVFAARWGLDELPGLDITGLSDVDARAFLAESRATLDEQVRERILAEARGNPLALLELPGAGGYALPDTSSVPSRVEASFQARLRDLAAGTRMLLTIASAEPTGSPDLLWAAAGKLGLEPGDTAGLAEFSTRVRFCHPLARSAVYRAATAEERHTAHRVLAEVTDPVSDPDRRAWHRAQAGTGPSEEVSAELERSASRAQARGGVAAAAAFLEQAAALSVDPDKRTERTLAAVKAKLDAGATDAAAALLTTVDTQQATVDLLRGKIAFVRHADGDGPRFMLRAAQALSDVDPARSRECFLDALEMALVVGRGSGVMDMVVEAARSAPPGPQDLLDALILLTTEGHEAAIPLLRPILASKAWTKRPALATVLAGECWDYDAHTTMIDWLLKTGRESGSPLVLRLALAQVATGAVLSGDFDRAMSALAEEEAIADAMGTKPTLYPQLHLVAMRGCRAEAEALIKSATEEAEARGQGQTVANVHWATAVLNNGLGDYPAALAAARQASAYGDLFLAGAALPELVEAAVRCGEDATAAAEELSARTSATGSPWGLGVSAYTQALVGGDEPSYLEAIKYLEGSAMRPYLARAHLLYGEWLRREGRRRDAREHLRTAHTQLSTMGMEAFAQRAAGELRATGEQARSRTTGAYDELTLQEAHIARLVATGATSKEVAAQLFLSPRTVDAHLRNIFRKLGITSRRQLRGLPAVTAAGPR